MSRRVLIYNCARINSTRLPRKLLLDVGGEPLMVHGLRALKEGARLAGVPVVLAMCREDKALWDIAKAEGVEVVELPHVATTCDDWDIGFGPLLEPLAPLCDWVIDANFLCRPVIRPEVMVYIAAQAAVADDPFVVVGARRDLLWTGDLKPLWGQGMSCDSQNNATYHKSEHLAWVFPVEMLRDEKACLARLKAMPIQLQHRDHIDVDTWADLEHARIYWRGMYG